MSWPKLLFQTVNQIWIKKLLLNCSFCLIQGLKIRQSQYWHRKAQRKCQHQPRYLIYVVRCLGLFQLGWKIQVGVTPATHQQSSIQHSPNIHNKGTVKGFKWYTCGFNNQFLLGHECPADNEHRQPGTVTSARNARCQRKHSAPGITTKILWWQSSVSYVFF